MKKLFSMILGLVCAAGLVFAVSGCDKEDEGAISNTLTIRGTTLNVRIALYQLYEEEGGGYYNFDVDAGSPDNGLHGYGGFDAAWVGKTTDLKGPFFLSFNPQDGGNSIDPVIKSGTVKITEVKGGLHVLVDAVEESGDKFKLDVLAEDETKINWEERER